MSFAQDCIECSEKCIEGSVHLFYSKTCPHCNAEIEFLKGLKEKYPQMDIHYMEAAVNHEQFENFARAYNSSTSGVPRTFIGDKAFIGFSKEDGELEYHPGYKAYIGYQNQIKKSIFEHFDLQEEPGDMDKKKKSFNVLWLLLPVIFYLASYIFFNSKFKEKPNLRRYWNSGLFALIIISLFLMIALTPETLIKNFASSLPFPLFVFIIALADGFNPCAFTVLIILLSLLTYSKERKSMLILGLTFILTSAVMYFAFIMIMISAADWAIQRYGTIIMNTLGIVILSAGLINLKDFFFFKRGISLSISDEQKSKITHKASKITRMIRESKTTKSFLLALGATVVLAAFVNLVELGCTAILPAIYMVSLINTYGHNLIVHVFWTIIYSLIYIIPLIAILLNFIYTFKSTRLTERQGRILKLIAGLFMLFFGILMIFNPELLMFT
ncbi:glutaredoxin family protein [Candidatus Woesearchaeota archaeon]|nr:glutaredoxin family protein [Candidatus Woesearchaeota archaeon]